MKYKVLMHVMIDARDDRDALQQAGKLGALLKHPLVRASISSEGVKLAGGDGQPLVYHPQRDVA